MDRDALRHAVNNLNLSTPLGLLVARLGGAGSRTRHGRLTVAGGYRLPLPAAPAFTIGDVVLMRDADTAHVDAALLRHEGEHAVQYAFLTFPGMLAAYAAASAWSWLRTGDWWSRNVFEVRAGLADGGYRPNPVRPLTAALPAGRRRRGT